MIDYSDRMRHMEAMNAGSVQAANWFSPSNPLPPVAPEGYGIRAFDYPIAANLQFKPKSRPEDGFTYAELRGIARACDEAQICIQTNVDRIMQCDGVVIDRGGKIESRSARAKAADERLIEPDGANSRQDFIGRIVREHCITDSACTWVDHDNDRIVVIDGTTIFPRINIQGEIIGYQQIIKGLPAANYSRADEERLDFGLDEIVWMPKNRRSDGLFGISPLEMCAHAALLAIRRKASQMSFFTEGTVPSLLIESPQHWNSAQTKQANKAWAAMLAGTMGMNRTTWIPNGSKPYPMERDPSKTEFDEWIIRQICGPFNVSPTQYVRDTNRASAETMQDASESEGHRSMKAYVKRFIDKNLSALYGPGLEWVWIEESKIDPAILVDLVKSGAVVPSSLIRIGLKPEEIRNEYDPIKAAQEAKKAKADAAQDDGKKEKTKGKEIENADIEGDFELLVQDYLDSLQIKAEDAAKEAAATGQTPRVPDDKSFAMTAIQPLHSAALNGAAATKIEIDGKPDAQDIEKPALKFARERAAELVGMKWVDGELVDNPKAEWSIAKVVRDRLRAVIADGFERKLTGEQIAQNIAADPEAFGPARSRNIARYEVAYAQEEGREAYLKKAGVKRKEWSDQDGCPVCVGNAEQGPIPMDKAFKSGHTHAPAHPNCRCSILPVIEGGGK